MDSFTSGLLRLIAYFKREQVLNTRYVVIAEMRPDMPAITIQTEQQEPTYKLLKRKRSNRRESKSLAVNCAIADSSMWRVLGSRDQFNFPNTGWRCYITLQHTSFLFENDFLLRINESCSFVKMMEFSLIQLIFGSLSASLTLFSPRGCSDNDICLFIPTLRRMIQCQ